MILTFRPIRVHPPQWQSAWARRPSAPFGATYSKTLLDLDREIRHLSGSDPFLQVDVTEADVRLDGQLRSTARPNHPGVLLTVQTKQHGPMTYGTDRFDHWHGNLRAIALGLDSLRRVERYGIADRGQQYAGYRELGSGIELGPASMTLEEAARFLVKHSDNPAGACGLSDLPTELIARYYREAAKRLHPDAGGDPELFKRLTLARDLLAKEA